MIDWTGQKRSHDERILKLKLPIRFNVESRLGTLEKRVSQNSAGSLITDQGPPKEALSSRGFTSANNGSQGFSFVQGSLQASFSQKNLITVTALPVSTTWVGLWFERKHIHTG